MAQYDFGKLEICINGSLISLTEDLYLESQFAVGNPDVACPVQIDGVNGLRVALQSNTGWNRFGAWIRRSTASHCVLALRVIFRIDLIEHPLSGLSFRAMLTTSRSARTRRNAIPGLSSNLRIDETGNYALTGLFVLPPQNTDRLDFLLNLPGDTQITLVALDAEWLEADMAPEALDRLDATGGEALKAFSIRKLADNLPLRSLIEQPTVIIHEEAFVGFELQGHAVTVPPSTSVHVAIGVQQQSVSLETRVEVAEGIALNCGFAWGLPQRLPDDAGSTLKLALLPTGDSPYRTLELPSPLLSALPAPRAAQAMDPSGSTPAIDLFYYPDDALYAPYLRLLYRAMPSVQTHSGTIEDAIARLEAGAPAGSVALHLHRVSQLIAMAGSPAEAANNCRRFNGLLRHFVRLGGRVCWTVHDEGAQSQGFAETANELGRIVAMLSHCIHVHAAADLPALTERYHLPTGKVHILPHPGYVGVYPDYMTRPIARARLGISDQANVFVCIDPPTAVAALENLLAAFERASHDRADAILLVVFNSIPASTTTSLSRFLRSRPRVRCIENAIPLQNQQSVYRAADWVILPTFDETTLRSALRAMSFSRPCIAPGAGALREIITSGSNGLIFDQDDPEALHNALATALSFDPGDVARLQIAALDGVKELSWADLGRSLGNCLLTASCPQVRRLHFEDRDRDCLLFGPAFPPPCVARTAIIILNFKNVSDVSSLVASLRQSDDTNFDVYIVDNNSPNLTPDELSVIFDGAYLLCLPENLGYAAGNNAAMRLISGINYEFVWILNPDIIVSPTALGQHVAAAGQYPDYSIFGATLLSGEDDTTIASAGCHLSLEGGLSTGHMYAGEPVEALPKTPFEAEFITGASIFLRKAVLDTIGLMPEDYFLYFEETAWLSKAARCGKKSLVLPHVFLKHFKRSEDNGVPEKHYLFYYARNALLFYSRMTGRNATILRPQIESGFVSTCLKRVARLRPSESHIYRHIAQTAIADGLAGQTGKVDLLTLEFAAEADKPAPVPGDASTLMSLSHDGKLEGIIRIVSETSGPAIVTVLVDGQREATVACTLLSRLEGATQWSFSALLSDRCPRGQSFTIEIALNGRIVAGGRRIVYLPSLAADYAGRIEGLADSVCRGWALNRNDSVEKLTIEIVCGDQVIARTKADNFRADLLRSRIGDGYAGFEVHLPRLFFDGRERALGLRVAGSEQMLATQRIFDARKAGEALAKPAEQVLDDLFYERVIWLSVPALEQSPIARFSRLATATLANHHRERPECELVSIVMTANDMADAVTVAIDSVRAQTYAHWELLIGAADNSNATTAMLEALIARLNDPRIRVVGAPKNRGMASARNACLAEAAGSLIAYLDSNHRWSPNFLTIMTGELTAHPQTSAAYCGSWLSPDGDTAAPTQSATTGLALGAFHLPLLENRNFIDLCCFVHRRRVLEMLGPFCETTHTHSAWEFILRSSRIETPHFVAAALVSGPASNALTLPGSTQQNDADLAEFARISARHRRAPTPSVTLRPLEIAVVAEVGQCLGDLIAAALDVQARAPSEAQITFILLTRADAPDPSGKTLPEGMRVVYTGERTSLQAALETRTADADLVLMSGRAKPDQGWLEHFNGAITACPDGGIFVSRHMISGRTIASHAEAVPFAQTGMDMCIALRADHRTIRDPLFDPALNLIELSQAGLFCSYFPADCASALHQLPVSEQNAGVHMEFISQVVRTALKRRILYCGNVVVYERGNDG